VAEVGPFVGRGSSGIRQVRTQPLVFSMADKKSLFYGTNVLWKTIDGGITWKQISEDLTRPHHEVPQSVGKYLDTARNQADNNGARVIYTIGPSYKDVNRIWIGTDDGVIQTTADGGLHWKNVTPAQIGSYWKVFMIEPGRFDPLTAYAAVNTPRTALRRIGDPGLRVIRRRRSLGIPAAEHGCIVGPGSAGERRRPRRGNARPGDLDSRRHRSSPPDRDVGRHASLQAGDSVARAVEHEHRHAAAA
jgi:hypothetical protein